MTYDEILDYIDDKWETQISLDEETVKRMREL